jgi:molybdenum cofactor biosynthesis enzyme
MKSFPGVARSLELSKMAQYIVPAVIENRTIKKREVINSARLAAALALKSARLIVELQIRNSTCVNSWIIAASIRVAITLLQKPL